MLQFFNLTSQELMESEEQELGQILESKFISQERFSSEVESIVIEQKCGYIDAIISYCEVNNLEVDSVPKLISKPLKEKIKCEAMNLNFLKKTSRAKLIF